MHHYKLVSQEAVFSETALATPHKFVFHPTQLACRRSFLIISL